MIGRELVSMKKGVVKSAEEFQMSELHIHELRAPVALLWGLPADPASVVHRMAMKMLSTGARCLFAYKHIYNMCMCGTVYTHIRIIYMYVKEASRERTHKIIAGVEHSLPPHPGGCQLEPRLCPDLMMPIRNPFSWGQMSMFPVPDKRDTADLGPVISFSLHCTSTWWTMLSQGSGLNLLSSQTVLKKTHQNKSIVFKRGETWCLDWCFT